MTSYIRVEIIGRDAFWRDAVFVEWQSQHPKRELVQKAGGACLIEADWLEDLKRVAAECFASIVVAPADPSRRSWLRQFIPGSPRAETARDGGEAEPDNEV